MAGQPEWLQVGTSTAEAYHRCLVPAIFGRWAPRLVDLAGVRPGERILDVACGTGAVTWLAAERAGRAGLVVGLDVNPAMLAVGRATSPDSGARVEWCAASALAMPWPDGAFDVVLCQQGLQQVPDRTAALREMRRALAPTGRLVAAVWGPIEGSPGSAALVDALARHAGPAAAENRRAPHALGDPHQLRRLAHAAGFTAVEVETSVEAARFASAQALVEAFLTGSPVSTLGHVADDALGLIVSDVRAALRPYGDADGLAVPMEANFLLALP
jgi:ubiquinone/menaquinone biosynthesis C-methylase UbiE